MKVTYVKANEEYQNLSENEKKIHDRLSSSHHINHLIHVGCYDDVDVIINFKLLPETDRDYFEFDIVAPLEPASKPYLIYHIKGSIFKSQSVESILYTVNSPNDNTIYGIYLDNKTFIKENVILNEIFKVESSLKKIIKVDLSIDKYPNQDETFVIDPKSQIYKLYSKGKIDIVSFCNFVLFQSKENKDTQTIKDNRISLTKKLSKNFLSNRKAQKDSVKFY